jgi:glycosyltransferase involved in cell wall biosynthesis
MRVQPQTPLVSIVVPCFNCENYINESIDSILGQTYGRTEVIVMDDASTDGTPARVAEYGSAVRYFRQRVRRGIYDNCNDGLSLAAGELVAFYHADDVYEPSIVEKQVAFLKEYPSASLVFAKSIFVDSCNREYGRLRLVPELSGGSPLTFPVIWNSLLEYKNRYLVCPTAMARATVCREIGGFRQGMFRNSADLDAWIRIARRSRIGILDEYLIRYRHSETQSSRMYHQRRTTPENYFSIIDHHLPRGGREITTRRALAAYEAHRAEDYLMIAVHHYLAQENAGFCAALSSVRPWALMRSGRVRRGRLLFLYVLLISLGLFPHDKRMTGLLRRHWQNSQRPTTRNRGFARKVAATLVNAW